MTDEELNEVLGGSPRHRVPETSDDQRYEPIIAEDPNLTIKFELAEYTDPKKKPKRNIGMTLFLTFFILVILVYAVYCIIADIQKGTQSAGYKAGDIIEVNIIQHDRKSDPDIDADENGKYTYEGIAKNIMPGIVEIYTFVDRKEYGSGSGIILNENGYIATNAHVVMDAEEYQVHLFGTDDDTKKQVVPAKLIGYDSKTDLAVLKISVSNLKPVVLGNSDDVNIGEAVCALGNPAGLGGSITTGIISGINRTLRVKSTMYEMPLFQTDAAISPGNSGGALVDMYGHVIGITSSKFASTVIEGLGFAIPINYAIPIIEELIEKGYINGRVRIGIQFYSNLVAMQQALADEKTLPKELQGHGILVCLIADDSDLKNTIFEPGNWILTMNGKEVVDYDTVNEAIEGCVGGDSVHCRCAKITDDGQVKTFELDFKLLEDKSGDY